MEVPPVPCLELTESGLVLRMNWSTLSLLPLVAPLPSECPEPATSPSPALSVRWMLESWLERSELGPLVAEPLTY